MKKAIIAMICMLTACSDDPPAKCDKLENTVWSRFDQEIPGTGRVYQVLEFNSSGEGRTDYKLDKKTMYVPIVGFTYKSDAKTVWITASSGNSDKYVQQGRFLDGGLLFGGGMFYQDK